MAKRKKRRCFLFPLMLLGLLSAAYPVLSQTTSPPPSDSPPSVRVIQSPSTSTSASIPQASLLHQVWKEHQKEITLAGLIALITGILIGVFIRRMADTLADWAGRLFHLLFDRFASTPLFNWRYDKQYRQTLARRVQTLVSSNIVDCEIRLDQVYVPVTLTKETQPGKGSAFEDVMQWDEDRRRRQREHAVEPWEAIRRFPRLVVMGEPGAGKTTYLSHLAFLCAHRQRLATHTPIFIQMRELVNDIQMEGALPRFFANDKFPNAGRYPSPAEGRSLSAPSGRSG